MRNEKLQIVSMGFERTATPYCHKFHIQDNIELTLFKSPSAMDYKPAYCAEKSIKYALLVLLYQQKVRKCSIFAP